MRIALIAAAALTAFGSAGYYAYAQTRERPASVSATTEASTDALERLRTRVMDHGGTERAFANEFWDHHEPGLYVEARTGEALFSSSTKFDSGTGWPSFSAPVNANTVTLHDDWAFGIRRTEVRSAQGNAHLGHVFNDGPRASGGQRYCMNSISMRFIPRAEMAAQGYAEYLPLVDG